MTPPLGETHTRFIQAFSKNLLITGEKKTHEVFILFVEFQIHVDVTRDAGFLAVHTRYIHH